MLQSEILTIENDKAKIRINDKLSGLGADQFTLFMYEKVPILKYCNPNIRVTCTCEGSLPPSIHVDSGDGDWKNVVVDDRTCEQILADVLQLSNLETAEDKQTETIETAVVEEVASSPPTGTESESQTSETSPPVEASSAT